MQIEREAAAAFLVGLTSAIDLAKECDGFEDENLIHFGLGIPETWRSAHQAFAEYCGFWWRPCPLCGEHFGAHECDDGNPRQRVPFPADAIAADPLLARCWQWICRTCSGSAIIERLAGLAASGKIADEAAVSWAALIYPDSDDSEGITMEAIGDARAGMMAG